MNSLIKALEGGATIIDFREFSEEIPENLDDYTQIEELYFGDCIIS